MRRQQFAKPIRERLAQREHHLEDADHNHQKKQRSPEAMQKHIVDLARVLGRERRLIAGVAADLRGPGMRAGRVAQYG